MRDAEKNVQRKKMEYGKQRHLSERLSGLRVRSWGQELWVSQMSLTQKGHRQLPTPLQGIFRIIKMTFRG